MFLFEALSDGGHLRSCRLDRDAILDAGDHLPGVPRSIWIARSELPWKPDVHAGREAEACRHHANDGVRLCIHPEPGGGELRDALKMLLPETIADDGGAGSVFLKLLRCEPSST